MSTTKGVIFTSDALLAVVLLTLFAASLAYLSSKSSDGNLGKLLLKKQSSDLLLALDKSGRLATMDGNRINQTLAAALDMGTGYSIEIEYYNYTENGQTFALSQTYWLANGNSSRQGEIGISQRNFVVAKEGATPVFGVARLSLWKD